MGYMSSRTIEIYIQVRTENKQNIKGFLMIYNKLIIFEKCNNTSTS
jgi:hypothetical protein